MHPLGGAQSAARAARARRVIERKITVMQPGGNEVMLRTAEIFPELF
jgi:hypothetical protein